MINQYDAGLKEDFNNMTSELGRTIIIYPRRSTLGHDSFEVLTFDQDNIFGPLSGGIGFPITFSSSIQTEEIAFIQELNAENEVVKSGELSVGDLRCVFKADSIAEEEGLILDNSNLYKISNITYVRGFGNDIITEIKAKGKKIPKR